MHLTEFYIIRMGQRDIRKKMKVTLLLNEKKGIFTK